MWRRRTLLLLGLGAFAAVLLAGFVGANFAPTNPAAASSACHVEYHPVGACAVPTGGTIDICSIVTDGYESCPIHEPDLNPVDWLNWLGCSIASDATDIWNAIVGDLSSFLEGIVNDLISAVAAPINTVLNALESAFTTAITETGNLFVGFFNDVNSVSAGLGPFAPVLTVVLTLTLFLAGGIGLYFAIIFLIAISKTAFNLA